ncbi:hypothetical protein LTR99_011226 [Exophiala xenobiotica]|uniref:Uncharacterized protein n=1 Tax=Vermiconidia calcicola TaxID=1690605 RepID=A0AAV9PT11_9PEZI|nr:hypothetical protein LTR99_011226 [Exophiala xenobiotica]KAK5527440.1 hypothetical protein LTR25_011198 [Vermiconidia calcicola]KAK5527851.1 hypothetical protein LTR23_011178 [Chaetothyriales sp. CCFEE 6169]KAK5336542.1 hypothetical protein LTR98_006848 [Exophiala xenobiotica]KAK5425340.1 hypothetical protein LTR34_011229 [Exophiala xenobiotica]
MSSSNPFDDLFSDDFDSQDFSHVPTPSVFGRTESEFPFPGYRSTSNSNDNEIPKASAPCLRPRQQPEKLAFLQLAEWDRDKIYDNSPPSYLRVTIGWKVTLNGKQFARDTEEDVVLTLASYWELILQPKVEKVVAQKRGQKKDMALQGTSIVVSVTPLQSEPNLIKQYDGTDIDWFTIKKKLVTWGEFYRTGKNLRVDLSVNYNDARAQAEIRWPVRRIEWTRDPPDQPLNGCGPNLRSISRLNTRLLVRRLFGPKCTNSFSAKCCHVTPPPIAG